MVHVNRTAQLYFPELLDPSRDLISYVDLFKSPITSITLTPLPKVGVVVTAEDGVLFFPEPLEVKPAESFNSIGTLVNSTTWIGTDNAGYKICNTF